MSRVSQESEIGRRLEQEEMIMSTTAFWLAGASVAGTGKQPKVGFLQRLIKAREREALRRIHSFLSAQTDQHLKDLGYTPEDIQAMREGHFRFSAR